MRVQFSGRDDGIGNYLNDYINIIIVINMESVETKVRKWGRSVGIVIPVDIVEKEKIKVNDSVEVLIRKKSDALKETFGTLRFSKSTQKMLDETDEELWND